MKKMTLLFVATALIALGLLTGFRKGEKGTTVATSQFDGVAISTHIKTTITVQEGSEPSVTITGPEDEKEDIRTKIENNVLSIYSDNTYSGWNNRTDHSHLTAEITLPKFTNLSISGSSPVAVHGATAGDKFELEISVSGTAVFDNVHVTTFSSAVSGSGSAKVMAGNATNAEYGVSGSGSIKASDLKAGEVKASVSGSGKCEVYCTSVLTAAVSGSGTVSVAGHPGTINKDISGSGSVKQIN
jgi:hypothetical protein